MKKLSFVARLGVATSALAIACVAWNLLPRASAQSPGSGSKSTSLSPAAKTRFGQQLKALDTFRNSLSASQRKLPTSLLLAKPTAGATKTRASLPGFATSRELTELQQPQSVIVYGNLTARIKAAIQREGKLTGFFPEARKATARLTVEAMEHIATATEVTSIGINPGPHVKQLAPVQQRSTQQAALRKTLSALSAPRAGTGAVVSEGDKTHLAEQARTDFNVTGSGIKIGVISDSVEELERLQKLGELPKEVEILAGQEGEQGISEGTAMMEIIYDLAPGAKLEFSTSGDSPEQMAKNILALQKDGCQIIVDDIGFFNESVYQEDVVSAAIRQVSANNVVYLTAIGNDGNRALGSTGSWDGYFVDAGTGADLNFSEDSTAILNDWNSQKDGFNLVAGNGTSAVVLSWAEPTGKAANDYNLYVVGGDGNIIGFSTDTQNGSGQPMEAIFTRANAAVKGSSIVVTRAASSKALPMRLFLGGTNTLEHSVGPTGYGHGVAEFALSVGASPALDPGPAPGPFTDKSTVEEFSSTGPRTLFFAPDGSASERLIKKPDITAADNVTCKTEGFDPFFGTSAAAPHAAAIAALAWSAKPNLTADQIKQRMIAGTIDIDAKGFDNASGNGIVMAPLVLKYTDPTPTPQPTATITPRPTATATPGPSPTPTTQPSVPGSIALTEPTYSVAENAGNARISVRRVVVNGQGDFGAVSVKYQTYTGGTATAESDYKSVTGTISWADGDSSTKTFSVPIIDDKAREGNETIFLRIYDLKGRGTIAASRKSAILTIIDNESGNVDKTKPKVAITRPAAQGSTRVSNVDVIGGTVSDEGGSGVKSVVLYIQRPSDGLYWNGTGFGKSKVALTTKINGKTWSRTSGNPPRASLKDDFLLITALASDGAGNTAQATANVFVDAEPPAVYILSPLPGTRLRTLARVNGTVSDAGGDSTLVLYLRRSSDRKYWTGSGTTFTATPTPLPVQLAQSGEWMRTRWAAFAPGNYVLTATGTDEVGNSATATSEFTIISTSTSGGRS